MHLLSKILVTLVAVEHLWFLALEMFLWTKPLGRKTFKMSEEQSQATATLAANQGLYNGFVATALFVSLLHPNAEIGAAFTLYGLMCVTLAGVFGGWSVNRRIFYVQSGPAILALAAFLSQ